MTLCPRLRPLLAACVLAGAGAAASASAPQAAALGAAAPDRPWTEQRQLLSTLRWWVEPAERARLQALAPADLDLHVRWAVPAGRDDGIGPQEQASLLDAKRAALRGRADPAGSGAATVRAEARITQAWRPWRALNVVLVALPGPGPAMVTQGGAAVEIELVDAATGQALAGFSCTSYAGVTRFAQAFGRLGHTEGALRDCAERFAAALRAGELPPSTLTMAALPRWSATPVPDTHQGE